MKTAIMLVTTLAMLGACGAASEGDDDTAGGADAAPGPDGGGGGGSDATPTPTSGTCEVLRTGAPVDVIFHDADGAPLAVVSTDVSGVARYDACVPDGMVTLVNPLFLGGGGSSSKLVTVQGVQIGDLVVFDPAPPAAALTGPVTVDFANGDDDASVSPDHYVATLGDCMNTPVAIGSANGGMLSVDDVADCAGDDPTNLAVVSIARSDLDAPRGLARVDVTDLSAPIAAGGGDWVMYGGPTLFGLLNWPAGVTGSFVVMSPLIDNVSYGLDFGGVTPGAETMSRHVWPATIADGHRLAFGVSWADSVSSSTRVRSSTPLPLNLDLADLLFARPNSLVLDVASKARPIYRWLDGDDRAVYARIELHWTDADHVGAWIIVAPGNPHSIEAPALPDEYAAARPQETAVITGGRFALADKGIAFSEWLEQGIDTRTAAESLPRELSHHVEQADMAIRYTAYSPD